MTEGMLLALVGPSGAGKDTVTQLLGERAGFRKFPTYTTRAMRPGESQGNPYLFVSKEDLRAMDARGELFNLITVGGELYALPKNAIREAVTRGERVVLHLVYEWALRVKREVPNTAVVLLLPPSLEEQRRRIAERGATPEEIERRLADPEVQNPPRDGCDLVVINETGKLEQAVDAILGWLRQKEA